MNISKKLSLFVATMSCVAVVLCGNGCNKSDQSRESAASEKRPAPAEQTAASEPKPNDIEWVYSVSEGLALAKKEGKPVIIDFYADWCGYCKKMDQTTFRDKRVIEELSRFITIKADLTDSTSKGQPAAGEYGIQGTPTHVFIDSQGKKTIEVGYRPPDRFLQILKSIK